MGFTDDLEAASLDIAEFAGHEAALTRLVGGDPVSCHVDVIRATEFQPEGFSSPVSGSQIIIEFCLEEIGQTPAVREDTVTITEGKWAGEYTVESEYENDGYSQKVIVK